MTINRAEIEELMDLCLKKMDDTELEAIHQICIRRIQACEREIARRKQEQPKEEGGQESFAS